MQETFLRWQAADVRRIEVPGGLADEGPHQPVPHHAHFGPRPARDVRGGAGSLSRCSPVTRCSARPTPPSSASRCRTPSSSCWSACRRASGRCTCCARPSTTRTGRSPRSWTSPRPPASRSTTGPKHVADGKARTEIDEAAARKVVEEFLAAATSGRTEPLLRLLTQDAVSIGDGGGKVPARAKAFEGALAVATFLRGLFKPSAAKRALVGGAAEIYATTANGGPAVVAVVDGRVVGITCLEVTAEGITAVRSQINPDKLVRATERWAAEGLGGSPLHTL